MLVEGGIEVPLFTCDWVGSYALPMRCPVLTHAGVLGIPYAMSGTDIRRAACRHVTWSSQMGVWTVKPAIGLREC
eukprot:3667715-Rhodomonas_salina.5